MRKTPSVVLFLSLLTALGCGASSDSSQPGGSTQSRADDGYGSSTDGADGTDSDGADGAETDTPAAGAAGSTGADEAPDLSAPADVAAPPADAMLTASGLASKLLAAGTGTRRPRATDSVRVHYSGWQTDGTLFDSSRRRGMPSEFPLDGVIAGWTEGLQLMVEGEQRRFWIPEALAYRGSPGRPSGTLVFDVELIAILTP